MKLVLLSFFLLTCFFANAQIVNTTVSNDQERQLYTKGSKNFSAVKRTFQDSVDENSLLYVSKNGYQLSLNPAFDLQFGEQNSLSSSYNLGFGATMKLKKKEWILGTTFLRTSGQYMDYRNDFINEYKVVPAMNLRRRKDQITADYISAFLNYSPGKIFDFELGYGRNFIGDGYRSLLLSDFGNASPYFKMNAKFWKIKYTTIFGIHQDIFQVEGRPSLYRQKYSATHYLDWKITNWVSLGLFESIVWQDQEENYRRGFDVNYLNSVIFYRPVEFSIGSSDNAIVGTNLKFTIAEKHIVYTQLVFDEFLLGELKADAQQYLNPEEEIQSQWWANKYALQLGWKTFDFFNIEGLNPQLEFNLVRPFTYSHSSPTQSYSHYNASLAHPLGANFYELISKVDYYRDRWIFRLQFNQYKKGFSPEMENVGENIFRSNSSRSRDYENHLTQGKVKQVRYSEASVSYLFQKSWNAMISVGFIYREAKGEGNHLSVNKMLTIGLKTNLYNQYFDF